MGDDGMKNGWRSGEMGNEEKEKNKNKQRKFSQKKNYIINGYLNKEMRKNI